MPEELIHAGGGLSITQPARREFDDAQLALIRDTVAKECNPAELHLFLETCARHQLDPIIKQIWTIKIKGTMQPVVARDGLLAIANRHTPKNGYRGDGEFLGCQADCVREHDFFDKLHSERPDGSEHVHVDHRYRDAEGQPTHGGEDGMLRGKIVGAWARVRRRGHDDTYFFAQWKTYNKGQNAWGTHAEAMIVKCAQAVALRQAFSVSGVIGEGEVEGSSLTEVPQTTDGAIHWPQDPQLRHELEERFNALSYRRAKIRVLVNGCDGDEQAFRDLLQRLDAAVDELGITDAEVVG